MTDETTGKPVRKTKRRPVEAAVLRLDATADHYGSVVIDPALVAAQQPDDPETLFARDLIGSPDRHGVWVSLPTAPMGSVKAKATARSWSRLRTIDGHKVRFDAVAIPDQTSGVRNRWLVAVRYEPANQPKAPAAGETAAPFEGFQA